MQMLIGMTLHHLTFRLTIVFLLSSVPYGQGSLEFRTHCRDNNPVDIKTGTCRCAGNDAICEHYCTWDRETYPRATPDKSVTNWAKCISNPAVVNEPHRTPYDVCMCPPTLKMNVHAQLQQGPATKDDLPPQEIMIIGAENSKFPLCYEPSDGRYGHNPTRFLGKEWCSLSFCKENNPHQSSNTKRAFTVLNCDGFCMCYAEPTNEEIEESGLSYVPWNEL